MDNPVFTYGARWRGILSAVQWSAICAGLVCAAGAEWVAWALAGLIGAPAPEPLSVRTAGLAVLFGGLVLGVAWRRILRGLFRRKFAVPPR